MKKDILKVTYVSVWDNGYEIETSAKYDTNSKLVFDIEMVEGIDCEGDEVETLDREYIRLPNGEELDVEIGEGNNYYTVA